MKQKLIVLALLSSFLVVANCDADESPGENVPATPESLALTFVQSASCAACHAEQHAAWLGSHHDLAIQEATEKTVLGDFSDSSFTHKSLTTRFFRRDGEFFINTENRDGELQDFRVLYTFGVDPLQQYLVEFPNGQLQVTDIAWDTHDAENGGQRWFHLLPEETLPPTDPLHWTGMFYNWNHQCAECHSTNLQKNYDADTRSYQTSWSEIDVACEACHGPGSRHVAWAEAGADPESNRHISSLSPDPAWVMDESTGSVAARPDRDTARQLQSCVRCHSRRAAFNRERPRSRPFLDGYRPALLDEELYYADGQILDEVYVWGSFLQSGMHGAGVICSDCHDPHSLTLRAPGNAVCTGCHLPERYDSEAHHHHPQESPGSVCVDCHMPERTYMVVDPRRDHSLRVPRPDLSLELGTPNVCNGCHEDRTAEWAANQVAAWTGRDVQPAHYGAALHAARQGAAGAGALLAELIEDHTAPALVRATAVLLLPRQLNVDWFEILQRTARDDNALVRLATARVANELPLQARVSIAGRLLTDSRRAIRVEAAQALLPARENLNPDQRKYLERALAEHADILRSNADRPDAQMGLATLALAAGDARAAEDAYRIAIGLEPGLAQPWANLADLYRSTGRDAEGEALLRQGLEVVADPSVLNHSLGLLLVRRGRVNEALDALSAAASGVPDLARYAYVYGVALHDSGQPEAARSVLRKTLERHPADPDILMALITYDSEAGDLDSARVLARRLLDLLPNDPSIRQLVRDLEAGQ